MTALLVPERRSSSSLESLVTSPALSLVLHPPSLSVDRPEAVPSRRALLRARSRRLALLRAVQRDHDRRAAASARATAAARRAASDLARAARGPLG